jgi:hypothetical protein
MVFASVWLDSLMRRVKSHAGLGRKPRFLSGDDNILIDALFTQLGNVDGGDGTDTYMAPAAWTKVSC